MPADLWERLRWRIVEGERKGIESDLALAMQSKKPLEIINVDLLAGMATVGDLFGKGEMQLPFVLQSAETMKAAVKVLEPHMERVEGQTRGKLVLLLRNRDDVDVATVSKRTLKQVLQDLEVLQVARTERVKKVVKKPVKKDTGPKISIESGSGN